MHHLFHLLSPKDPLVWYYPLFHPPAQNPTAPHIYLHHFLSSDPNPSPPAQHQMTSPAVPPLPFTFSCSQAHTYLLSLIFPDYFPHQHKHALICTTCPRQLPIIPSCSSQKKNLIEYAFGNCCPSSSSPLLCPVCLLPPALPSPNKEHFNPIESTFPEKKVGWYSGGKFI